MSYYMAPPSIAIRQFCIIIQTEKVSNGILFQNNGMSFELA